MAAEAQIKWRIFGSWRASTALLSPERSCNDSLNLLDGDIQRGKRFGTEGCRQTFCVLEEAARFPRPQAAGTRQIQ